MVGRFPVITLCGSTLGIEVTRAMEESRRTFYEEAI